MSRATWLVTISAMAVVSLITAASSSPISVAPIRERLSSATTTRRCFQNSSSDFSSSP